MRKSLHPSILARLFPSVGFRKAPRFGIAILAGFLVNSLTVSAEEDGKIRILGIGNSFTQNATKFLPQIIASNPSIEADVGVANIGGCPLDKHVNLAKANEEDPTKGKQYTYWLNGKVDSKKVSLKEILEDGTWDYITIQQVSTKSYKIETYYPYAEELIGIIRKHAPDATIVIHETWSHSKDSYRYTSWGLDPDEMYSKLHAAYGQIAEEFSLPVIPVGTAFQMAKEVEQWDYQPTEIEVTELVYPADKENLPDESKSLHRIFYWKKNKKTGEYNVGNDGFHANRNGEYLGGLVWYGFFFDADPTEVSYAPNGMTEEQAESLQVIAAQTLAEEPENLRLNP